MNLAGAIVCLALFLFAAVGNVSAAANDAFGNPSELGSVADASLSYDGRGATRQVGEPSHESNSSTGSLWWRWTAPSDGQLWLKISYGGNDSSGVREVYSGNDLSGLTRVAATSYGAARVFPVAADTVYQIAVADNRAAKLVVEFFPLPANDDFANRTVLGSPADCVMEGATVGATLEAGEPVVNYQGPTIWWSWQAPADGLVSFDLVGTSGNSWTVRVYTGETLSGLVRRTWRSSSTAVATPSLLRVKAGESFAVVASVDGTGGVGRVRLNWSLAPMPYQATAADAVDLGSVAAATGSADNRGEPVPPESTYCRLWWRWTPPTNGILKWVSTGKTGAYVELFDANLQPLAYHSPTGGYRCRAGQPCLLSIMTTASNAGILGYQLTFESGGENDDMAGAWPLAMGDTSVELAYAGVEADEPTLASTTWGRSRWWEWTAPADGALWLDMKSSSLILGVWGVAPVKPGIRMGYGPSQMMVAAKAGETLRIGLLESDGFASVPTTLTTRFLPATSGNDAFADAADLGSALTAACGGDPTGATREAGEPTPADAGGSLWWKWTAPEACNVRIQSRSDWFGTTGSSSLYVYRGSGWGDLTAMAGTAVAAGETLWLTIIAPAGQPAVSRAFELSAVPNHANDAFANAIDLGGVTAWQAAFYLDATSEPGEPRTQPSLWWKWTAPNAGNAFFSVAGSWVLGSVYQGSSLADLSLVTDTASTGACRFIAQAGATYWLAVSGSDATSKVQADWRLDPPPPGDWFAAPVDLGQASEFALNPVSGAGIEAIEAGLFEGGYDETLWWRWTAPADGRMVVKATYADTWKLFEETGGAGAGLTPVTNEQVLAGRHYRIANIDGTYKFTSSSTWRFHPIPASDHHAGAIDLGSVAAITTQTDLYAATVDATELALFQSATYPPTHGVWWRWTAPFDGVLKSWASATSNTLGDLHLAVLMGTDPMTWRQVAGSTSSSSYLGTECLASVKAGRSYLILLAARAYTVDLATLILSAWPAPANNEWVDAADLGADPVAAAAGSNVGATRESFEGSSGSGSVWWKWTAPIAGNAFVTATVAKTAASLGIYQPSGEELVPVAGSAITGGRSFRAGPGQTYWISVAGSSTTTVGDVGLTVRLAEIPANDDFANRIALGPDLPVAFSGTTTTGTVEPGEAVYDSTTGTTRSASLWWSWTAPFTGAVRAECAGSGICYLQTGDSLSTLTTLKRLSGGGNFAWLATAGVTYHLAVTRTAQWGGSFNCQLFPMTLAANDSFAERSDLGVVAEGEWDVNTLLCTAEAGEPAHAGQAAASSVWFEWTAPAEGGYRFDGAVGGYQARVGIYQGGAVDGLQKIAGGPWQVPFVAAAGQTYQIAVDGTAGLGQLKLKPQPLPPNDLFANRILLPATLPAIRGSTILAGMETGEPRTSTANPQRTLWWEWVAPNSAPIEIQAVGSTYAQLEVYSSPGVATGFSSLSFVTAAGSGTTFSTTSGRHYYFRILSLSSSVGESFDFRLGSVYSTIVALPPPNDDFANRTNLGSALGLKATGDFYGATRESWETVSSSQVTLWWSWTAPGDGIFGLLRSGSQTATMAIMTGSSTAALTTVATGTGRTEWFRATAGTTYQLRCAASSPPSVSSNRFVGLELVAGSPPANDHFAAAVVLPEPGTTSVEGFNAGASAEPAEPAHGGAAARASVWYQWTATVAGPIQVICTSATMRAGVYQGSGVAGLTQVAGGNTPLTFTAALGETYRIALDSAGDETFFVRLGQPAPLITNDAFGAASELIGTLVEVPGSTVGATLEPGEPYHTGSGSQGGSVWWHWTAPASGAVAVSASGVILPHFAIYQGTGLGALAPVAAGSSPCVFLATAGTTYRLAASATSSTGYSFSLRLEQQGAGPPNDAFANAQVLDSGQWLAGTLAGASREADESWHGSSMVTETVWYRWTAPASGRGRATLRSGTPGALVIYRGSGLSDLTEIVAATTEAGFAVSGGEEFRILVGRTGSGIAGPIELSIGMTDTGTHDDFANRLELGSVTQASWTGALEAATMEPGETPYEYDEKGSRWWTWTAPADGGASLQLGGGKITPTAHIYTGNSITGLELLTSSTYSVRVAFPARAGTTYQIALRGKPSNTGVGDYQASLLLQPQPNDAPERALSLAGVLPVSGAAVQAGAEYLWWQWIAPTGGVLEIDFSGTEFSANPTVWAGPGLPLLDGVPLTRVNDDVSRFTAVAGTRYWIRTAANQSTFFGTVGFELRAATAATPPNDRFADALPLSGDSLAINTVNFGATDEPGEPLPQSRPATSTFTRSLWWWWVAPRSGLLRVKITSGWAFLYEGSTWGDLREVAGPGGATSTTGAYWVTGGRTYQLAAGNSSIGPVVASLELSPPGDRFADALDLGNGAWVKRSGSLAACFWEPGEPLHHGSAAQASLWFRWQAPAGGNYRLAAKSGTADLRTAAYQGDSITGLVQTGSGIGGFTFAAEAGRTYRIVVDGGSSAGAYELVLAAELPGYTAWRDQRFDFMDATSAPAADPDHDGRSNLLEFALGSQPLEFTPGPAFTHDSVAGKVRLNVRRPAGLGGWDFSFDLSESLAAWVSSTGLNRVESVEDHGDGTETLHVTLTDYRYEDHSKLFFRLKVAQTPGS